MVRQTERGEEPSSRHLPSRFDLDGGTMQYVPSDVLQELQQQREDEKEDASGRAPTSREGSLQGAGRSSQTHRVEDGAHPGTSPSTSCTGETAGHSRHARPGLPRRRPGRYPTAHSTSPEPLALSPQVGPATGSRAATSPSWSSTAEAVPSQLLGGRAGADANFLELQLQDYLSPMSDSEPTPRQSPVPESSRLSIHWTSRKETDAFLVAAAANSTPPRTPQSGHSTPSISTQSLSSGKSDASSFAHMLRDNRADKRLFQKRNLPMAHRQKRGAIIKRPPSTRSASFYKPKVVEDTATPVQTALQAPSVSVPSKIPSTPLATPSPRPIHRKDRSSMSQSHSDFLRDSSRHLPTIGSRQGRDRPASPHNNPVPRHAHFGPLKDSQRQRRDSLRDYSSGIPTRRSLEVFSPGPLLNKRSRELTPPEREPRTPYDSTLAHDDHYFRMFGSENIYERILTDNSLSAQTERIPDAHASKISESPLPTPRSPSDHPTPSKRSHLRNSVLNIFHIGSRRSSLLEEAKDSLAPMSSPLQSPSDVKSDTPSKGSRKSSSDLFASYFPVYRRYNRSSDISPRNSVMGLATNRNDMLAESPAHIHSSQESTPLSPLSKPMQPVRLSPKRRDGRMDIAQPARQMPLDIDGRVVPSEAVTASQPIRKLGDGGEHRKTSFLGPRTLSWLPSEMKRVNTPPSENLDSTTNDAGTFKDFRFDKRLIPVEQSTIESESLEPSKIRRRKVVLPTSSLQKLLPKLSLKKSKRKATEFDEKKEPDDPLAVTDFQQTPFSQRYGDTRRNKMSRIRSYVDEILKQSEDEEAMARFEFEVPDHLPSSPLCPLSPKHMSGGRAICPIHRRKKTMVTAGSAKADQRPEKQSPRIVYESNQQGRVNSMNNKEEFNATPKDSRT